MYIGIIVFQLLKHSDELDIKPYTLRWGQHFYWRGGTAPCASPAGYGPAII